MDSLEKEYEKLVRAKEDYECYCYDERPEDDPCHCVGCCSCDCHESLPSLEEFKARRWREIEAELTDKFENIILKGSF